MRSEKEGAALTDPNAHNDWVVELDIDLAASREANAAVVRLVRLGSLE